MTREVRVLRSDTAKPPILVVAVDDAATPIAGQRHRLAFAIEK
jgi:hypothetical protein